MPWITFKGKRIQIGDNHHAELQKRANGKGHIKFYNLKTKCHEDHHMKDCKVRTLANNKKVIEYNNMRRIMY